jgi:hypothetical protein
MLAFDDSFAVDSIEEGSLGCVLWASEPKFSRVRFHLRHQILMDVLHGENPVHHQKNIELCEKSRARIEKACRRALVRDQCDRVELNFTDFW